MKNKLKRGFTLIELLIVIAIIGIISSVILQSLSTSRTRAYDSKIKSQLRNFKNAVELYNNTNGGYTASTMTFPALPCTGAMFIDATSRTLDYTGTASAWPTGTLLSCQSTTVGYAVSASLKTSGQYWCIDNAGNFKAPVGGQLASGDVNCN